MLFPLPELHLRLCPDKPYPLWCRQVSREFCPLLVRHCSTTSTSFPLLVVDMPASGHEHGDEFLEWERSTDQVSTLFKSRCPRRKGMACLFIWKACCDNHNEGPATVVRWCRKETDAKVIIRNDDDGGRSSAWHQLTRELRAALVDADVTPLDLVIVYTSVFDRQFDLCYLLLDFALVLFST